MKQNKALLIYLSGALGQIVITSLIVCAFRYAGKIMDYSTLPGIIAIAVGGISSALWGTILSIKYKNITFKRVISDFFKIRQSYKNYLLMLGFLGLDFAAVLFGGGFIIKTLYLPFLLFIKAIAFGGFEEIGWRYFFQPLLQERIKYVFATIITFATWAIWHFLYFYIDGTLAVMRLNQDFQFLAGLLVNSFILSALYTKTKNLWLCVMTHSLINVFSQLTAGENLYVSYICKAIIIAAAIAVVHNQASPESDSRKA